jgi:hypothetical protein
MYFAKQIPGFWEYAIFPGMTLITLSLIGLISFSNATHIYFFKDPKSLYFTLIFIFAFIFSLGPFLKFERFSIQVDLPFFYFANIFPGIERIRAPGRFGMFLTVSLGYFSLAGLNFIKTNLSNKIFYNLFIILILSLIFFDSRFKAQVYPFKVEHTDFYRKVSPLINHFEPTLILPLHSNDHISTIKNYIQQLHSSNIHDGWILAGYGSKSTDIFNKYTHLSRLTADNKLLLSELLCNSSEDAIRAVILHGQFIKLFNQSAQINLCGFTVRYQSEDGILLRR